MINLKKKNKEINNLLKNSNFTTKIYIYPSTRSAGEDFDPYEKNYTYTNLNPRVIKGYVRELDVEKLVWRQIGTGETGAKEILCDAKYADLFRNCNKIEINSDTYEVYKEATGNRSIIQERPFHLIRVVISKK